MGRWNQTWRCQACGHTLHKVISYPKHGGSDTPLTWFEKKSRCKSCGLRGTAKITEEKVAPVRSWKDNQ